MADVTPTASDTSPDWGTQLSTFFLDFIDKLRGKTTGPILKVARALVYGIIIMVALTMVAVLAIVGLVRFTDAWLPGNVWAAYLLLGGIFFLAGAFSWSKRTP